MTIELQFLLDLTVALGCAVIGGFVASRLHLSPIVGYLVAGIIVSPSTPGYAARVDLISGLAQLGLIFLLFSLGLGFSLGELRSVGKLAYLDIALIVAFAAILWVATAVAHYPHPITMALAMVVSSTAIGVALLRQWNLEHHRVGTLVLSLAIIEDLIAVGLVVVASTPGDALSPISLGIAIGKALAFVLVALLAGKFILQPLTLRLITRAPSDSLFGAFTAIALTCAWLGHWAGISFEFGAFVAGAVVGEAAGSRMVQSVIAPFRELFVSLFFVSVGMLFDPELVIAQWPTVIVIGVLFCALRWGGFSILGMIAGLPRNLAFLMGMALVPLGEFNIVLVNQAFAAGRLDKSEEAAVLGITFLSIGVAMLSGPFLGRLRHAVGSAPQRSGPLEHSQKADAAAIVIGFGRVGHTVSRVLLQAEIPFVVVERDRKLVAIARNEGFVAVIGDGSDPAVIERHCSEQTRVVISTIRDMPANIAIARRISGTTHATVVSRAQLSREIHELVELGAAEAIVAEVEGAFSIAEAALRGLNFADDEIEAAIDAQRDAMALRPYVHERDRERRHSAVNAAAGSVPADESPRG